MTESTNNEPTPNLTRFLESTDVAIDDKLKLLRLRLHERGNSDSSLNEDVARQIVQRMSATKQVADQQYAINLELREMVKQLTEPPWPVARFIALTRHNGATRADVMVNGAKHQVGVDKDLDADALGAGDEVYLNAGRNAIVGRSALGPTPTGECCVVDRTLGDGRLVITDRGVESVLTVAAALQNETIRKGDLVRVDRQVDMAVEKIDLNEGDVASTLSEIEHTPLEALAGLDDFREQMLKRVIYAILHPEEAARFCIPPGNRILLVGPPGVGKTLTMKVIASALNDATGRRCRLASVNGANLNGSYVGESERAVRRLFRSLRGNGGPAVLFIDELDAIGRLRGELSNVHGDRTLNTWLTEFDGIHGRPDTVVIATTNRADIIDPALRERFTWEIAIPRPRKAAAAAIFARHFPEHLPYSHSEGDSEGGRVKGVSVREQLIDYAVDCLYDPNGGNQVATLRFRDGSTRAVSARDLMSGRIIEQTSLAVRQRAFERAAEGSEAGITLGDMAAAIADTLEQLRATLTVRNAGNYLADLPQDIGVVAVESVAAKQDKQRFLR